MSAECHRCGWDLPYDGECVRCELERERDEYKMAASAEAQLFDEANARLKVALRLLRETGIVHDDDSHYCQVCGRANGSDDTLHEPDCEMAAVLQGDVP